MGFHDTLLLAQAHKVNLSAIGFSQWSAEHLAKEAQNMFKLKYLSPAAKRLQKPWFSPDDC